MGSPVTQVGSLDCAKESSMAREEEVLIPVQKEAEVRTTG